MKPETEKREATAIQDSRSVTHTQTYLEETREIASLLRPEEIEALATTLAETKRGGGRLFFLGVGGSAANASHAVNDFRKLCGFEAYSATDNVSELTARTNDEGWDTTLAAWLEGSRLRKEDAVFILSVGGGNQEKNISPNLVKALDLAKARGTKIVGIVGRDGGHTKRLGDAVVVVPTVNPTAITPHSEAFQAVIWHLLVSHPLLKTQETKWEVSTP